MHGPQALARTVPPTFSNISSKPSRSMVALTCSDPLIQLIKILHVNVNIYVCVI